MCRNQVIKSATSLRIQILSVVSPSEFFKVRAPQGKDRQAELVEWKGTRLSLGYLAHKRYRARPVSNDLNRTTSWSSMVSHKALVAEAIPFEDRDIRPPNPVSEATTDREGPIHTR